ncbi:hypothetical protein ACJJTC_018035 [Scirpophaga incertulas]
MAPRRSKNNNDKNNLKSPTTPQIPEAQLAPQPASVPVLEGDSEVPTDTVQAQILDINILEQEKHPLENTWVLWLTANVSKDWKENLIEITSFNTVEDFWCLYHHMILPSELEEGQDFSLFKQGVRPMWEDPANTKGGRLVVFLEKKNTHDLNRIWLDTILMLIGENFDNLNHLIRGVVVNIKPKNNKNRISVWFSNKNNSKENMMISQKLKDTVSIPQKLGFYAHNSHSAIWNI